MKILTNKQYDLLSEIVMEAKMKSEMLEADNKELLKENAVLKRDLKDLQDFCMNYSKDRNLDFPSTKKLNEDKFI